MLNKITSNRTLEAGFTANVSCRDSYSQVSLVHIYHWICCAAFHFLTVSPYIQFKTLCSNMGKEEISTFLLEAYVSRSLLFPNLSLVRPLPLSLKTF